MAKGPNPAMRSKRVTGPTPNTEMLQRIREQEVRVGGRFVYNPRTGKRRVLSDTGVERDAIFTDPSEVVTTVHRAYH